MLKPNGEVLRLLSTGADDGEKVPGFFQKLLLALGGNVKRPQEPQPNQEYGEILESYREFIRHTIERYRHDFETMSSEKTKHHFSRFERPFRDELESEASRLIEMHAGSLKYPAALQAALDYETHVALESFRELSKE